MCHQCGVFREEVVVQVLTRGRLLPPGRAFSSCLWQGEFLKRVILRGKGYKGDTAFCFWWCEEREEVFAERLE